MAMRQTAGWRWQARRGLGLPLAMAACLAVACAAVVGLDGWRMLDARREAVAADQDETANLARSLAQQAHDTLHLVDTILLGLRERAEQDGLDGVHLDRLRRVMQERLAGSPGVLHGLFIYDAQGDWIVNSKLAAPGPMNNADRAYFRHHRSHPDRAAYVGAPVRSKSDGAWVVTVSHRLDDAQGGFAGVVLATVPVSFLADFYASFDIGRQGIVSLVMSDGTLVARSPHDINMIGRDLSGSEIFAKYLPKAAIGSFQYASIIDGVVRLGSYRRVPDYPLVIVVAHGLDEVLAPWLAAAWPHMAASVALAGALGIVGLGFLRHSQRARRAEAHYRLLADNSSDAIVCVALDGRRLYVSPAFAAMTGWSARESLAKKWGELVHPDDLANFHATTARLRSGETEVAITYRYICKSGAPLWVEARLHLVAETALEEAQYVISIRDISGRKAAEDQLAAMNRELAVQARTDGLTGLANRRRFDEALDKEWRRGARELRPLSLLMVDVDRFKRFNDRYGHPAGDVCLRAVAAAIAACVHRPGDLVARYGGEEIAVILPSTDLAGALEIAEAVRKAVQGLAIAHEGNPPAGVVTVSIGVASRHPHIPPGREELALELTAAADACLYQAKNGGRNRAVGEAELPTAAIPPLAVDEALRLAAVDSYGLSEGGPPIDSLDRLARLTAVLFQTPIAAVTLVGSTRQCFVGQTGLDVGGTARELSFCAHAMAGEGVFTVADATADQRFAANLLVLGEPKIRFYAGAPLIGRGGQPLGALCVIDRIPRPPLSPAERALLKDLADLAASYLDRYAR